MLNEKLAKAEQENRKQRRKMLVVLGAIGALCAVLVVAVSVFKFPTSETKEAVPSVSSKVEDVSQAELEKARSAFKEKLQIYENQLEPLVKAETFEKWNAQKSFEIDQQKRKAISSFSNGDYAQALNQLDDAIINAKEALHAQQDQFDKLLDEAQQQYDADNYELAKFNIDKAISIFPNSDPAIALQKKIELLPQLTPLLGQAHVAKVENNPEKEFSVLSKVIAIDPSRTAVKERLAALEIILKDRLFQKNITQALSDIESGNAQKARQNYERARVIYPDREEIAIVQKKLLVLESRIRFNTALSQAEKAIQQDDWAQAKRYFEKAAKENVTNTRVVEGLGRANEILRLKSAFTEFQSNPYRLTNANYRKKAEADLVVSEEYGNYSFSLMHQADDLTVLIDRLNHKKEIFIESDNQTFVQVRGVGKVGKTLGRSIQLKPGQYTFEGIRTGYKSKLVKVLVPYNKDGVKVKVICDEPI